MIDALRARIEREGSVRYDEFVELALYDPSQGFFTTGGGAGRGGADFITSPEVGPLFGLLVAEFLDRRWDDLGRPDPYVVVEAAAGQFQLDIYGELADMLMQAYKGGLPRNRRFEALAQVVMPFLEEAWRLPDEGIWEVRGGRRHFTHSKVMAWVAVDRTIRSAEELGLAGPLARWRALRDRIHQDVCERGFDRSTGSFVQCYGADALDAGNFGDLIAIRQRLRERQRHRAARDQPILRRSFHAGVPRVDRRANESKRQHRDRDTEHGEK